MRAILFVLAVLMILGWVLGVFLWSLSGFIHILLILAIISLLLGIIRRA
jgi:Family of unknown function (DUF5670)